MKTRNFILFGVLVIQGLTRSTQALQPEVLYEFQRGPRYPEGSLVKGGDGNFYGTTSQGGSGGAGTVFKMTPDGDWTTLISFNGTNGSNPFELTVVNDGDIYGTTQYGGSGGQGTIFRVTTNGERTTLMSFDGTNGASPRRIIVDNDGSIYGAFADGQNPNDQTIFKLSTNGILSKLFTFYETNGFLNSLVLGSDGNLYGATSSFFGTTSSVFRLTFGGELTTLAIFDGANGELPMLWGRGIDGRVYGTVLKAQQILFRIDGSGALIELALLDGTGHQWGNPVVLGSDGNAYYSDGVAIFKATLAGKVTMLTSLGGTQNGHPYGLAVDSDGNVYGTATGFDGSNVGTVFKVTPNGELSTLVVFTDANGMGPTRITLGPDGKFYGSTRRGGSVDSGTVFSVTTNGQLNTLASLSGYYYTGCCVGRTAAPSQLTLASDGNLYGVTETGGSMNFGTVFRATTNGDVTTLVSFIGTNGAFPVGPLALGRDGSLYGTTAWSGMLVNSNENVGGFTGAGTVFKVSTCGELTVLVTFPSDAKGTSLNGLTLGLDGSFYGTTRLMGGTVYGTVFRVTTNGVMTTLASFNGMNGTSPSELLLGLDGNFYGVTESGGQSELGTVFKVTINGELATLVSFNGVNGANPQASLVLGTDGNFYGTTAKGGSAGYGTVFKVTSDGVLTTLVSFNGANGAPDLFFPELVPPDSALVFGNDGNLYGTTTGGGSGGGGTIFRIVLPRLKTPVREPGGRFLLTGAGPANDSYRLWASSDLSLPFAAWTLLTSSSFDSKGTFSFTDATTNRTRFYQLSVP